MAVLAGHSQRVAWVPGPAGGTAGQPAGTPGPTTATPTIIDGTPVRVVILALSAAAGLVALHAAGFRFSLGVSA
jgi:hypothetical protein